MAPIPRDYVTAAAPLPTALATLPELNKQQRYDQRMSLLGNVRGKPTAVPDMPAPKALERLQRNNVAMERARLSAHVYDSEKYALDATRSEAG